MFRKSLLFIAISFAAVAQKQDPQQLLVNALGRYGLHHAGLKPWHMQATVQTYNRKGAPAEVVTVEEFFQDPEHQRIHITYPGYEHFITVTPGGRFVHGNLQSPPYGVYAALQFAFDPSPTALQSKDAKPLFFTRKLGPLTLNCVMLSHSLSEGQAPKPGLFKTYCMDPNTGHLRANYAFGALSATYLAIGGFQGSDVPMKMSIMEGDLHVADFAINTLATGTIPESMFEVPEDGIKQRLTLPLISGKQLQAHMLKDEEAGHSGQMMTTFADSKSLVEFDIDRDGIPHNVILYYTDNGAEGTLYMDSVRSGALNRL